VCEVHEHDVPGHRDHRHDNDDFELQMVPDEEAGQALQQLQAEQQEQYSGEDLLHRLLQGARIFYVIQAAGADVLDKQCVKNNGGKNNGHYDQHRGGGDDADLAGVHK